MRILLIFIFYFLTSTAYCSMPRNFYSFYDFLSSESLHPFSNQQIKLFKEKGVKEVISTINNLKSTYQINKEGYVKSIKTVILKKQKETFVSQSFYQYNGNNQVLSIKGESQYQVYYDTLTYDNMGRVIYYKEVVKPKPTVKKKENHYNYSNVYILKSSNSNYVLLTDSSTQLTDYRINNNNELIFKSSILLIDSVHYETKIDSVHYEMNKNSTLVKKYYYKTLKNSPPIKTTIDSILYKKHYSTVQRDSLYRIGQIKTFQNNQIQSIKTYQTNSLDTTDNKYKIYTYDNSRLLRIENIPNYYHRNDMTLYTYHQCQCQNLKYNDGFLKREGLLQKKISLHFQDNKMTEYIDNYDYKFY